MTSIDLDELDPAARERLRLRAARHGRSMAAEAQAILVAALSPVPAVTEGTGAVLVERIRRRFAPLGGVELELPPRGPGREPPSFE